MLKLILLQEAMTAGPFLVAGVLLLFLGIIVLLFLVYKLTKTKPGAGQTEVPGNAGRGTKNKTYIFFILVLLTGLIVFGNWLCTLKFD
jgi:hypothetical protein